MHSGLPHSAELRRLPCGGPTSLHTTISDKSMCFTRDLVAGPLHGLPGFCYFFVAWVPGKIMHIPEFQKRVALWARNVYSFDHPTPRGGGKHLHVSGQELHILGKSGLPDFLLFSANAGCSKNVQLLARPCRGLPPGALLALRGRKTTGLGLTTTHFGEIWNFGDLSDILAARTQLCACQVVYHTPRAGTPQRLPCPVEQQRAQAIAPPDNLPHEEEE